MTVSVGYEVKKGAYWCMGLYIMAVFNTYVRKPNKVFFRGSGRDLQAVNHCVDS
jgi:hypothetical protein